MRTGGHTIEVFADNVAGSSRTVQFTLESQGDVTFVDPNVGANVAVTTTGCTQYWTISCAQAGQLTINGGQLVVQADTKFNLSSVIGGAPNQVIGRFIATAYGEDEKVYTFTLTPSLTGQSPAGALGLNNVSLYLNGGQVGTSQN
ncbi:MAG: hypothetical protein ORN26_02230 [Candidatus Pacebacteria bacterium]|nr:hypothetical protein [Candidatus Paceibacterota bacterium]